MRIIIPLIYMIAVVIALNSARIGAADQERDLPLLFSDDFEHGADRWKATDPAAWKVIEGRGGHVFSLFQQSKYEPSYRSPINFSLIRDMSVSDFELTAKARSTSKDYGHRDMCLFFAYQDPAHFYYVHLGKQADDHANQIFIVNGAARVKISTKTTTGTPWDDGWHKVKVVRDAKSGDIQVFFDDFDKPAMTAKDKTFSVGQVGVGSFDDTGEWDDVRLFGKKRDER